VGKFHLGVGRTIAAVVVGVVATGAMSGCMDVAGSSSPGSAGTPVLNGVGPSSRSQDGLEPGRGGARHREVPGASSTALPSPSAGPGAVKPSAVGGANGAGAQPTAGGSPSPGAQGAGSAGGAVGGTVGGATGAPTATVGPTTGPTTAPPATTPPTTPPAGPDAPPTATNPA
jgi:hypothetical protein